MRCKERGVSEERWVSYSDMADSKEKKKKMIKEEEWSSCIDDDDNDDDGDSYVASAWCVKQVQGKKRLLLALKLIMGVFFQAFKQSQFFAA